MRTVEHPLVRQVEKFIRNDGVLFSFHDLEHDRILLPDGSFQPTYRFINYCRDIGVDPALRNQVFNTRGELIYRIEQQFAINSVSPEAVAAFISASIETPMHLINPAIAGPNKKAKNNHDFRHAKRVWETGDFFMQAVGTPTAQRRAGAVALLMHDIGNLLGRDHHPQLSILLRREFFPGLIMDQAQEEMIDEAILIHDGDLLYSMLEEWGKDVTVQEAIELLSMYGDVALSLIIGDKLDIGLDRLPSKEFPLDLEDPHRIVNLYAESQKTLFYEDLQKLAMQITFGAPLSPEKLEQYSHVFERGVDGEIRRKLPDSIRRKLEHESVDEYTEAKRFFWEIYFPRMMLTVLSSFAIDAELKEMVLVFENQMVTEGSTGVDLYHFSKDPKDRHYIASTMQRIFTTLPQHMQSDSHAQLFLRFAQNSILKAHN